jgi:hypothetical protein
MNKIKTTLSKLYQLRGFIITLAVILLIGFTAYQCSRVTRIEPDQAMIEEERAKLRKLQVKFDAGVIEALNRQSQVSGQTNLSNLGKSDPFSP